MGCGCGKSRAGRAKRLKQLKKRVLTHSTKNRLSSIKKIPITKPQKRTLICKSCPYSTQTSREKKAGILVCHKTNRLVNNLILDPKFNCPVGKWN